MLIANPIYDTVFKYMMENIDIAKGVISTIIDEEIEHLDFKAQESTIQHKKVLTVFHVDFIARIKQKKGGCKNVLIEMQKSNMPYDIMRFRRYVGEQYKKEDDVLQPDGSVKKEALPIISIYFLGFRIPGKFPGVIKVNRNYHDVLKGKVILKRSDFIEKLSHDCYVIQIPELKLKMKNRLEYILSIFKQENFIYANRHLKDYAHEIDDELMRKILKRLEKAAADSKLMSRLDLEEIVDDAFDKMEKELEEREQALETQGKVVASQGKAIDEKDKAIDEKDRLIKELKQKLEQKK